MRRSDVDRVPVDLVNEILWEGMKGSQPYPTYRSGRQMNAVDLTRK
jgi:hypothetical protein